MVDILKQRPARLLTVLAAFFLCNALIAEFIGIKIFALETSLGFNDFTWNLFGQKGSLDFTAGVILWPFVFILTDVINDYFGVRGVRFVTLLTAVFISYGFLMIFLAINLVPAEWWISTGENLGVENMQTAFAAIYGQGLWIIGGSLTAFLLGQLIDAFIFRRIKEWSGDRMIWLRATVSTIIGQLIDSFVVLYIAFVLGPQQWSLDLFIAVGSVNFVYKLGVAILLIPLLYLIHGLIGNYLGKRVATEMRLRALKS